MQIGQSSRWAWKTGKTMLSKTAFKKPELHVSKPSYLLAIPKGLSAHSSNTCYLSCLFEQYGVKKVAHKNYARLFWLFWLVKINAFIIHIIKGIIKVKQEVCWPVRVPKEELFPTGRCPPKPPPPSLSNPVVAEIAAAAAIAVWEMPLLWQ